MQNNFKVGICTGTTKFEGCWDETLIVYKAGKLCNSCNNRRKQEAAAIKAKEKPLFTDKAIETMAGDKLTYMELWNTKPHYCEECNKFLGDHTAEEAAKNHKYVFSHILKKGMYGLIRNDARNFNLLCFEHHNQWESANTRKTMNIWEKNKEIMMTLLTEYGYRK